MSLRLFASLLVALAATVAGCGQAPVIAPTEVADAPLEANAAAGGPLAVFFNDTYGETVAENEPRARAYAGNTDKSILRLIRGARRSLVGAFYDISDPGVVDALIKAKRRDVDVALVTDSDNMTEEDGASKPRDVIQALKSAGIPVREDKRSAIMHHKFLVVDGLTVWCGSTNITPRSLYQHNNNAVVIRSEAMASKFAAEFDRLFGGSFGLTDWLSVIGDAAPINVGGASVQVLFSPRGGGRAAVLSELKSARRSIELMTFSLTDKELGDTIVSKHKAGLRVEGVFDNWLAAGQYSLYEPFKKRGLSVLKDGNQALLHHKIIIIDGKTVITGSFNYSENAEASNNENFLIVKGSEAFSNRFGTEFKKVWYAAKHNHPPYFKEKDSEVGTATK